MQSSYRYGSVVRVNTETWEEVANAVQNETGMDGAPMDAFDLATVCGLTLIPVGGSTASLSPDDEIRYPCNARPVRQHGLIAHEVGHWALNWQEEESSEQGASWVAGALMLPRLVFDQDLTATSWDLTKLKAKHINVSAEMIARRIVQLRDAVTTIFDQGKVKVRVASPWLGNRFQRLSKFERELADRCLTEEEVIQEDDLIWAVPVIDGIFRRVILVCELKQLSLRL